MTRHYLFFPIFVLALTPNVCVADNPAVANAYDIMLAGQEISSGAQRIHEVALLEQRARAKGVDPTAPGIKTYVDAFRVRCHRSQGRLASFLMVSRL